MTTTDVPPYRGYDLGMPGSGRSNVWSGAPRVGLVALAAIVLAMIGAAPALAFDHPHGTFAPVQGTVTYYSTSRVQVSTNIGPLNITLNGATHVVRVVSGSTADLHPNQIVDLHLVPGTNTVDAIRIEAVTRTSGSRSRHHDLDLPPQMIQFNSMTHHGHGMPAHIDGQVVSSNGSAITVRTPQGKSSYTISKSVTVTKLINGSLNDLAVGETVQVFRGHNGCATTITIMSA